MIADIFYDHLPNELGESVKLYVKHGIQPGSFLSAVIENNLHGAFYYADDNNRRDLFLIVKWFHNHMPTDLWGNRQKAIDWATSKGSSWK